MKFSRKLSNGFISTLNDLYEKEDSWWRKIVDDDEVFILIRNNDIRVQVNGGLFLHVSHTLKDGIICRIHEDFLSLRSKENTYVVLDDLTSGPIQRVEGLTGFVKHYPKIKRRINIFTGAERKAVQYLANNIPQIVDVEVGFEGELKNEAKQRSVPRIDMAAITDSGTIVFFEVKLFDNNEIRSKKTPQVVSQLEKYRKIIDKNQKDIVAAYKEQLRFYEQLNGRFFEQRARKLNDMNVYPDARLIITSFDASQRDIMLTAVRENIERGVGWETNSKDLIATGNHKNLTKSNRLFLGLR